MEAEMTNKRINKTEFAKIMVRRTVKWAKGNGKCWGPREALAGKAAYSQVRKVILTALTHGPHTLHTPAGVLHF